MNRLYLLASVLLFTLGCGDYPPTATCPSELAAPSSAVSCDDATTAWASLLVEVQSCERAADCAERVANVGCNCMDSTPIGAISDELLCRFEEARYQRENSCELGQANCVCEPYLGTACIQGQCTYR